MFDLCLLAKNEPGMDLNLGLTTPKLSKVIDPFLVESPYFVRIMCIFEIDSNDNEL